MTKPYTYTKTKLNALSSKRKNMTKITKKETTTTAEKKKKEQKKIYKFLF